MPAISILPTMTGSAALSEDIEVRTFYCRVRAWLEFSIPRPMRGRFAHLELESDFIDWGSGSNRAEIYSSVLYARSTHDLGAGKQYPGS
jgi:hypothetical protein